MSDAPSPLATLRRTPILIGIVVGVVIVLIWLVAFFLPQGSKLSKLSAQQTQLQQEVTAGNAKVAHLKNTFEHAGQLEAMLSSMEAYVPSTPDIFKSTANYTSTLSAAGTAAGVTVTSVNPSGAHTPVDSSASTSSTSSTGSGKSSTASFTTIPITVQVTGTYDDLLSFIKGIYALPRLTVITSITVSGGGPGTSRTTVLKVDLSLVTFTTAKPPASSP